MSEAFINATLSIPIYIGVALTSLVIGGIVVVIPTLTSLYPKALKIIDTANLKVREAPSESMIYLTQAAADAATGFKILAQGSSEGGSGLSGGLSGGLPGGLSSGLSGGLSGGLSSGLSGGLSGGLSSGLPGGLSGDKSNALLGNALGDKSNALLGNIPMTKAQAIDSNPLNVLGKTVEKPNLEIPVINASTNSQIPKAIPVLDDSLSPLAPLIPDGPSQQRKETNSGKAGLLYGFTPKLPGKGGGVGKTKSNRKTNKESKVKKQKKPRTKKCLVTKGNQMYMSFCV